MNYGIGGKIGLHLDTFDTVRRGSQVSAHDPSVICLRLLDDIIHKIWMVFKLKTIDFIWNCENFHFVPPAKWLGNWRREIYYRDALPFRCWGGTSPSAHNEFETTKQYNPIQNLHKPISSSIIATETGKYCFQSFWRLEDGRSSQSWESQWGRRLVVSCTGISGDDNVVDDDGWWWYIYYDECLSVCVSRKMITSSWEFPVTTWTTPNTLYNSRLVLMVQDWFFMVPCWFL